MAAQTKRRGLMADIQSLIRQYCPTLLKVKRLLQMKLTLKWEQVQGNLSHRQHKFRNLCTAKMHSMWNKWIHSYNKSQIISRARRTGPKSKLSHRTQTNPWTIIWHASLKTKAWHHLTTLCRTLYKQMLKGLKPDICKYIKKHWSGR